MLAHFGSSIESSSNEISFAVYENNWAGSDVSYRKSILMTMISVNDTVVITVGKIFPVNLPTFVFVSRKSFSVSRTHAYFFVGH